MCDGASAVALIAMAAGAGMQYQGQKSAAKSTKRTIANALAAEEKLRSKALRNSEEAVESAGPKKLTEEANAPQQVVAEEGKQADQLGKSFADAAGIKGSDQGAITSAVTSSKRTAKNEATKQGFAQALKAQLARLNSLTTDNLLLADDSRRIQSALPYQLQQAGAAGANQRLIGGAASTLGQGMLSQGAWQERPQSQPNTTGMSGTY